MAMMISRILENAGLLAKKAKQHRALMLGMDSSGKTSVLYQLRLGELVTTLPTIGFNVEEINNFVIWDMGGCDQIRPLWRHYYKNTSVVFFFVDANDRDRVDVYYKEMLRLEDESEFEDAVKILVANKIDLPNAMNEQEIRQRYQYDTYFANRGWKLHLMTALKRHECTRLLELAQDTMQNLKKGKKASLNSIPKRSKQEKKDPLEEKFKQWLNVVDESDDDFEAKLVNYTLENWDHRTHLRIAWLHLKKYGRRKGMKLIFERIANFIAHSPRTNGRTFHETMTYFWVHMVHYAMATSSLPCSDFQRFLVLKPQLAEGSLFLIYYSKALMLNDVNSRKSVVLPDKKPLPSLITHIDTNANNVIPMKFSAKIQEEADEEFVVSVEKGLMKHWSHTSLLRLVYSFLIINDRNLEDIFKAIQIVEKEHFHLTITYVWIHLVYCVMAEQNISFHKGSQKAPPFYQFQRGRGYELINDPQTFLKYYSKKLIFSKHARTKFILPDLLPLPCVVGRNSLTWVFGNAVSR